MLFGLDDRVSFFLNSLVGFFLHHFRIALCAIGPDPVVTFLLTISSASPDTSSLAELSADADSCRMSYTPFIVRGDSRLLNHCGKLTLFMICNID